ncbi:centrosomal protein of 78 kDa [Diretmus argenteus]
MVQDSAQIRKLGAQDFAAYYDYACGRQESVPLPAVKMNLAKGMLDFHGDRVKVTDWPPILNSVAINKHLHHIAISSTYQANLGGGDTDRRYYRSSIRKKIPAIRSKDMTLKLCKALRECLTVSPNLKTLQLNGLPLRERDLITLTKGLAKSVSLENLSLANCPITDEGLEVICQSVKYSARIKAVDFTGCNLTWRGAEHMANIIKHQGMQRHSAAWAESLRYRQPEFEGMGGLRRVTLNCNTLIGDRGAAALAHELAEDLWVKAVDLQRCGMSNEGARRLLEALKTNSTLCVLDIRSNPLVDKVLMKTTIEKVLMNAEGQSSEYYWIKPPALKEQQKAPGPKRRALPSTIRGKTTFRIAPRSGKSAGRQSPVVAQQQRAHSHSGYVPWRAAARAGRQRGLPSGVTVVEQRFQGAATVKVTVESDSEDEEEEEVEQRQSSLGLRDRIAGRQFQRMQVELEECRLRLAEERRARLKAESRLMEYELENARLHSVNLSLSEALVVPGSALAAAASSPLEDEAVLESIESSFAKFHAFLDLLKDAGLGQLASIAGIDQSNFRPLGKPQLSSTIRQPMEGAESLPGSGAEYQDIQAKIDAASLVCNTLSAPSGPPADAVSPRPPSSAREFLLDDRPLEGPFKQAAIDPCVDLECGGDEPDQYSKPEVQHASGSECSFHSQKSYGMGSFGNKSSHVSGSHEDVSQPNSIHHHRSNGNSYHSDSHGYSFNYSNVYSSIHSDASCRNKSHDDLSMRSSLSDMSEKVESIGSLGSKNKGRGRQLAVGHSGSEGGKAYPHQETLDQIRSMGSLGGQSDD